MRLASASRKAGSTTPEKSTLTRRFMSVRLSSRPPWQKVQRSRIRLSMASRWSRAELFWIAKNGIKMSGMPAFGSTHKDEEIWRVVSFVQRLPRVTEEDYAKMEHA
jgi:hypothetical protein